MPRPDQIPNHKIDSRFSEMLESVPRSSDSGLAKEIAGLRKEIAELRAELKPLPSLLVTGREALDEFSRLLRNINQK